jgi:crossover junction endodeoxyribonuclease RuvC
MNSNITIVGIDPGTGRCGYSVLTYAAHQPSIITYGCFEYSSKMPLPERLVCLEKDMAELLDTYKPTALAVETLIFNKNITTAMQVSEARGVIILAGAKRGLVIQNCSPLQVKMAVTGYGRAEKSQVKQMIKLQLKLGDMHKLDDAIDALAIGITGYHLMRNQEAGIRN